jgi:hypothetical protein
MAMLVCPRHAIGSRMGTWSLIETPIAPIAGGFRDEIHTIAIPMVVRGNPMSVMG